METYETEGIFPQPTLSEGKYFQGPIRSHHRPRSYLPTLFYGFWLYFAMPYLWNNLLGSVWGTIFVVLIIIAGMIHYNPTSDHCSTSDMLFHFLVVLFMLKLIEITMISRGSSYGSKITSKSK